MLYKCCQVITYINNTVLMKICLPLQVGFKTSSNEVQCLSNHLTSFAAQVFVAPNAIDFDKALIGFIELSTSSSNSIVLSVVVSILGVYLLLIIWARRLDVQNEKKVICFYNFQGPPSVDSNSPKPTCQPGIHMETAVRRHLFQLTHLLRLSITRGL